MHSRIRRIIYLGNLQFVIASLIWPRKMSTFIGEVLRVKKLSEFAIIPTRGSEFAAGYDLSSAVETVVPARGKAIVKTDLAIAIPENTYARIAPR